MGGNHFEGNRLEPATKSFVGEFSLPMRHGLTLGECGLFFNREIGAELSIVKMEGWQRGQLWPSFGRPWVLTSPNMSIFNSCLVFPGMVLFEGTNLSEGRGTTLPFLLVGAPYLRAEKLKKRILEILGGNPPGLFLRPASFQPNFSKWSGQACEGLELIPTEPTAVRSFQLALAILQASIELGGKNFSWRQPPYEYEHKLFPIEILIGKPKFHEQFIVGNLNANSPELKIDAQTYKKEIRDVFLYKDDSTFN